VVEYEAGWEKYIRKGIGKQAEISKGTLTYPSQFHTIRPERKFLPLKTGKIGYELLGTWIERKVGDRMAQKRQMNSLKSYRENVFISKAELARKAGISEETIARIEKGKSCRLETKRKIILALGLDLSESDKIFGDDV